MRIIVLVLIQIYSFFCLSALLPQKVIGQNDFIFVNLPATNIPIEYRNYVDAIGRTNYGCTVTHLGHGIAVTAGHCFEAKSEVTRNKGCRFAKVSWGYRQGQNFNHQSQCENIISMQKSRTADFAILKISNPPKAFIPFDLVQLPQIGDELTLFSHPNGQPLQWSQYCLLEWPRWGSVPAEKMNYFCDTEGGSSGAVILSTLHHRIVGIHNGGFAEVNYGTYLLEPVLNQELLQVVRRFRKLKSSPAEID